MNDILNALSRVVEGATFDLQGSSVSPAQAEVWYRKDDIRDVGVNTKSLIFDRVELSSLVDLLAPHLRHYMHEETGLVGNGIFLSLGGSVKDIYISVEDLAKKLVVAGVKLGPDRVVYLFSGWISGTYLRTKEYVLLEGIKIEAPFSHNGIEIFEHEVEIPIPVPYQSWMPPSKEKKVIGSMEVDVSPALYKPSEKAWNDVEDDVWAQPSLNNWRREDYGASWDRNCEAIAVTLGGFVGWQQAWRQWKELNAFQIGRYGPSSRLKGTFIVPSERILFTRDMLIKSIEIDRKRKTVDAQNLDLAIRRWVRSHIGNLEDQLIELRIALEALYAQGVTQEIARTIATRGAWHLGGEFEERRSHYETLRKVYHDASRVIHAGRIKYADNEGALLESGRDLCREAILAILKDGTPDWDELVLGKKPEDGQTG